MKILALDVSTKSGWAVLDGDKPPEFGLLRVEVEDFNVNDYPERSPKYPLNMLHAANEMAAKLAELCRSVGPDIVVVENTVKGRNRHTQRILEWIHKALWDQFCRMGLTPIYRDPSAWRFVLEIRLSNEDKKNNKMVKQGLKRGKIGKKHLSVRWANERYGLTLKLKDNDVADALALASAIKVELSKQ
jgi:hypothetical protein